MTQLSSYKNMLDLAGLTKPNLRFGKSCPLPTSGVCDEIFAKYDASVKQWRKTSLSAHFSRDEWVSSRAQKYFWPWKLNDSCMRFSNVRKGSDVVGSNCTLPTGAVVLWHLNFSRGSKLGGFYSQWKLDRTYYEGKIKAWENHCSVGRINFSKKRPQIGLNTL